MMLTRLANVAALVVMPFVLTGVRTRVKSLWSGRKGPPVLQLAHDVRRLFRKSSVYSTTTTPLFRTAPYVVLATAVGSALIAPLLGSTPLASFQLDFVWFAYVWGLGRVAIMLAALSNGVCKITNFLEGEDCLSTIRAFQQLGVTIERPDLGFVVVHGSHGELIAPESEIDCGNSGTTMRLLAGILAAQPFAARLVGDASLSKRPMQRIIEPLTQKLFFALLKENYSILRHARLTLEQIGPFHPDTVSRGDRPSDRSPSPRRSAG